MSAAWAKNLIGIHQLDFELLQVPHPKLELGIHITLKCVEAGTLLGSIISPVYQSLMSSGSQSPSSSDSTSQALKSAIVSGGLKGAVVGLAVGPVMSALFMRNLDTIGIYDRCYRLRFNSSQLFVDRTVLVGAAVGAATQGKAGLVLGIDLGILASAVINRLAKK